MVIGTLSKAVGTEGGFVAGSKVLIDFLLNYARSFIFQTAIPPSICAASYAALDIIEEDKRARQSLQANVERIKSSLDDMGYIIKGDQTPIIPVIIGDANVSMNLPKVFKIKESMRQRFVHQQYQLEKAGLD